MAKLKPVDKKDIIKMFTEGVKISRIAHCFNVDPQAIRYVINNYEKYGESSLVTKTVGRKKLSDMTEKEREIYLLKKENEELKLENEILKQIKAFCEQKTKKKQ